MKNLFYVCLVLLAISCSSDSATDQTAIDLVTGVTFRQTPDDLPQTFGNPNVRVNDQFVLYPNPTTQYLQVVSQSPISDVWIIPAHAQKIYQSVDFSTVLHSDTYSEATVANHASITLNAQTSTEVVVNLESLTEGYYRIFVKINGALYWDNMYLDPVNTEEHTAEVLGFWD